MYLFIQMQRMEEGLGAVDGAALPSPRRTSLNKDAESRRSSAQETSSAAASVVDEELSVVVRRSSSGDKAAMALLALRDAFSKHPPRSGSAPRLSPSPLSAPVMKTGAAVLRSDLAAGFRPPKNHARPEQLNEENAPPDTKVPFPVTPAGIQSPSPRLKQHLLSSH